MLTELGKELRKLRIDRDELLLDMAKRLGKSSSFLSAVEIGRKTPPEGFEEEVVSAYGLKGAVAETIRRATDQSRTRFSLEPQNAFARDTAGMLARRFDSLSKEDLVAINGILNGKKDDK